MTRVDRWGERIEADEEGMSTRAIAPIVGVGDSTIQRDLADAPNGAPDPKPITGMDGKTYTPRPPDEILAHCAELRQILADARE